MRIVLQRVSQASVTVDGNKIADIQKGLLVLVGIEDAGYSGRYRLAGW